jgi:hypothetical protein
VAAEFARLYQLGLDEAAETAIAFVQELAAQGLVGVEEGRAGTHTPAQAPSRNETEGDPA